MNVLLDTNVFLRYFFEPGKLKRAGLDFLADFEGEVFLSAACPDRQFAKYEVRLITA